MWDARTDPHTDLPVAALPVGLNVAASVTGTTGRSAGHSATVTLTPVLGVFDDPGTVYPVTIDPTAALGALAASGPALAQFRVEVTGVGLSQLPIAIVPFRGEAELQQKLASIVQADLERSGQFRAIDPSGAPALDETSRPDRSPWRAKTADSLAVGSATRLADGRYDVRFRLWDVVRGQSLAADPFMQCAAIGPSLAPAVVAGQRLRDVLEISQRYAIGDGARAPMRDGRLQQILSHCSCPCCDQLLSPRRYHGI